MITEKHYTAAGEHPADRIFKDKTFINRLQKNLDDVFEQLSNDLNLNELGKEWLFDYVFNEDDKLDFEEYLEKFGFEYEQFIAPKQKAVLYETHI